MQSNIALLRDICQDGTKLYMHLALDPEIPLLGNYGIKYMYAQGYSLQHYLLLQTIRNDLNTQILIQRVTENTVTSTQWNNMYLLQNDLL